MEISYEYQIANMDVASIGGKADVVVAIHYRVVAKADGINIQPVHSGVVELGAPVGGFTAFDSLTKEQVGQWLKAALNVEAIELGLRAQLEQVSEQPAKIVTQSKMPSWL